MSLAWVPSSLPTGLLAASLEDSPHPITPNLFVTRQAG